MAIGAALIAPAGTALFSTTNRERGHDGALKNFLKICKNFLDKTQKFCYNIYVNKR